MKISVEIENNTDYQEEFTIAFFGFFIEKFSQRIIDQTRKQQEAKIDSARFIIKEQRESEDINVSVHPSFGFGRKNIDWIEQ